MQISLSAFQVVDIFQHVLSLESPESITFENLQTKTQTCPALPPVRQQVKLNKHDRTLGLSLVP